jgi:TPP-dependent pyruvate/acetoin dehydrogenase alpha subunit
VLLEYELSAAGLSGGRLGSMNLQHPRAGLIYTSSILGNNLPVACGVAMALKERGETAARVYVATGDGAIEEGAFWESLVLAASHSLNVCFLVENNDHSLATRIAERRCAIDLGRLAAAVGVDYELLTGNDPVQYAASLAKVLPGGGGPLVREAMVTTFCNHAGPTPGWATDPRTIDAAAGLELEASPRDPVHVARRALEEEEYQATNRFLTALAVSLTASHAADAADDAAAPVEQKQEEETPACRLT